jgi:hypothetical protein
MKRFALCLMMLAVPALYADKAEPDDPKAPKARELKLEKATPEGEARGRIAPIKVADADELSKHVSAKAGREEILKQVNLKREYLVLFRWAGSGGDRVMMSADGDKVKFTFTPGRTRDLQQHFKVFALPAKSTFSMGK